jgi:hypothetical protein
MKGRQRKTVDKDMAKARTRDSMQEVAKLTRLVDGRRRIISDPPLLVPIDELLPRQEDTAEFESQLLGLIGTYRRTLETAASCSRRSGTRTWPARSSAWAASGPGAGSS